MPFKMRFYQVLEYIIRELHAKQKHFIIATGKYSCKIYDCLIQVPRSKYCASAH